MKKNIQISIKRLVEYQPKPIQQGTATSVAYRKNWTELLSLYRSVCNSNEGQISSELIIKSLVELKLFPAVALELERITRARESTTLDELFSIISDIISSMEACEVAAHQLSKPSQSTFNSYKNRNNTFAGITTTFENSGSGSSTNQPKQKCIFCTNMQIDHPSNKCQATLNMPVQQRRNIAYQRKVCYNCLLPANHAKAHKVSDCRNPNRCRTVLADGTTCNEKHHTFLCYQDEQIKDQKAHSVSLPSITTPHKEEFNMDSSPQK